MSAEKKTIKLIMLFESEIRKAALLLSQAKGLPEKSTEEEKATAWEDALRACIIALNGAEEEKTLLILTNDNWFIRNEK